ncbi:sialin-like [Lampetra planeri]
MSGRRRGERATETGGREESGDEEDPGDSGCRDDIPVIEPITNGRRCSCRSRHVLAALGFVGLALVYALRVNLSVAMVAMVNSTGAAHRDNSSAYCPLPVPSNGSRPAQLPSVNVYNWDSRIQGWILSSFFYGYIITQVPGGYLAGRYGGKLLFGVGVTCTTVLTLLTPIAAHFGVPWLLVVRVLEGLGEGVTYPTMHAMWALWAPPHERSTLMSICYSGGHFGTVVAMPLSGIIADKLGWPWIFYIFGGTGLLWSIVWFLFAFDSPERHPRISAAEREFILKSLQAERQANHGASIPWRHVWTCMPLWAINVAMFCGGWGFYVLLTSLPTYMSTVLHYDMQQNGLLSALPYLAGWLFTVAGGVAADALRIRGLLSITAIRKVATTLGLAGPSLCLVASGFVGCNHLLAVSFLTLSVAFGAFTTAGCGINQLDIAPQYAGVLLGISNTFNNLPGFLAPTLTGYLTEHDTLKEWHMVFFISAGINMFGALFYLVFGSGKQQSWAREGGLEEGASPEVSSVEEADGTDGSATEQRWTRLK